MTVAPLRRAVWAGGTVLRREGEVLLVHRPRYDDWSLPKGKAEPGEDLLATALRELEEESGMRGAAPVAVGTTAHPVGGDRWKVVRWWSVLADGGRFRTNAEVDAVAWLPWDEAEERVSYRNDRAVIRRARRLDADPTAATLYVVRHAVAGVRGSVPVDEARPLDARGRLQALALADDLDGVAVTRILTSPYRRCAQTVAPLGKRLGIEVEEEPALVEGVDPERTEDLLRSLRGEAAVLCTHGDVVGALVGRLLAAGVPLEGPREWPKGSVWVLEAAGGAVRSGRYLPPPV